VAAYGHGNESSHTIKGVKLLYESSDSQLLRELAIYPSGVKTRVMAQPQTLDPFSRQNFHLFLLSVPIVWRAGIAQSV
jgi:hypothetical protein